MELPQDVMNHIKTFLPPHPLQKDINIWSRWRKDYFYKWYFSDIIMQKKKDKSNDSLILMTIGSKRVDY